METQISQSLVISQSLAMAHNYIQTGRCHDAVSLLNVVKRIEPDNQTPIELIRMIAALNGIGHKPDLSDTFGILWGGEDLNGKSIEVFSDQGMGDLLNMLRYMYLMKSRWNCRIILNCYAFYDEMKRLMGHVDYIDEFVKFHKKCDYTTNLFSLPTILSDIKLPIQYPAHFEEVMKKGVPDNVLFNQRFTANNPLEIDDKKMSVGVSWRSNSENELSIKKSIPSEVLEDLYSDKYNLYSLDLAECPPYMNHVKLFDLCDTAAAIRNLHHIVSVDTVTLHLAGIMGHPAFGLIPDDCDPRWGIIGKDCIWYPSVEIIRQNKDWSKAIKSIKNSLEHISDIL